MRAVLELVWFNFENENFFFRYGFVWRFSNSARVSMVDSIFQHSFLNTCNFSAQFWSVSHDGWADFSIPISPWLCFQHAIVCALICAYFFFPICSSFLIFSIDLGCYALTLLDGVAFQRVSSDFSSSDLCSTSSRLSPTLMQIILSTFSDWISVSSYLCFEWKVLTQILGIGWFISLTKSSENLIKANHRFGEISLMTLTSSQTFA